MYIFFIALQVVICIGLIFLVLIQSGRGGGLVESFSSAESLLGTKTSSFLVKATTALAIAFFINCIILAFLTIQQNKSKMSKFSIDQRKAAETSEEIDRALRDTVVETTQAQEQTTAQVTQEAAQEADVLEESKTTE